ncbi:uncharacterized protein BP5553_03637 [Venustampulla echinocandica]|uniref:Heterokaryon incompatibility domain-containing protein n=1 Tax=Venustampulla echinocandica TaxID=2656787 RepID=A0A370TUT5_9HELO|nr:uncharacterized protein BP5553_03637 [Venustampulla echinocandica]RDL39297.1 hypothetical protein BP5553_03637 [Venustampulla echinocandica]
MSGYTSRFTLGNISGYLGDMCRAAIALDSRDAFPGWKLHNARIVDSTIYLSMVKRTLDMCLESHGKVCSALVPERLQIARMVDITTWKVVPYPANSNKKEQLEMMDQIYAGATVTIVAMAGKDSDSGLPGVSDKYSRREQLKEVIEDMSINGTSHTGLLPYLSQLTRYGHGDNDTSSGVGTASCDENEPGSTPINRRGGNVDAFARVLASYSQRRLTNEQDSLNAMLGILSAIRTKLIPSGFIYGLPLQSNPQSLGWIHDCTGIPKRLRSFPSWSWCGWEGKVKFPDRLLFKGYEEGYPRSDLHPQVVAHDEQELSVEGLVVQLGVVTKAFGEALILGTDESTGYIKERNFAHNNTLPSGIYSCLVAQRVLYEPEVSGQGLPLPLLALSSPSPSPSPSPRAVSHLAFLSSIFLVIKTAEAASIFSSSSSFNKKLSPLFQNVSSAGAAPVVGTTATGAATAAGVVTTSGAAAAAATEEVVVVRSLFWAIILEGGGSPEGGGGRGRRSWQLW